MTDRARLEKALIAADQAGDVEAARKIASAIRAIPQEPQAQPQQPAPQAEQPQGKPVGDLYSAVLEPVAALGSGAIGTPIAGLAGLGAMATRSLGWTDAEPADVVRRVQGAMQYEPRTKAGDITTGAIAYPFQKLEQGADWLGGKVAEATDSPALGAAVNTGVQMIPPTAVFKGMRGRGKVAAQQAPTGNATAAQAVDPKAVEAEARAKEYVARTASVDWSVVPREIQATLTKVARDAGGLEKLDAEAVKRQLQLQSLPVPVPATRGIVTRDPVQLRNEGNVSATEAGRPIRETHLDANQALLDNLEVLKGRVANKKDGAQTPEQVGISVQDQALRAKLELKKKEVSEKYKLAEEAGELQGRVSPARLIQTINKAVDKTYYGWVDSWMKANDVVTKKDGVTVTRKLTLKEMESLRQEAVSKAMDGGTDGYHAGKIIQAIDATTEGAGGKLYKEARKARREQALEFEETGSIARLVDNKSRTDRATALEDTWRKTVIGGSIQDLRNVKRSLLTGGDAKTRSAGKRAWRDVKAQTIQHIQNEATKGVALNERGVPNVTPAAMKRAIDSIGRDKLNEIFGPGTAVRLDRILEATRTVKTVPPALHQGSSTMGNVLAFLERGLNKVPIVGDVGSGAIRAGVKLKEMGEAGRVVRQSQEMPIKPTVPKRNKLAEF